jgi:5-methylcytosine-specific restriction enzyme A
MATYLLAWNPKKSSWDDLSEMTEKIRNGEQVIQRWSCGVTKRIAIGDRVFLNRLGVEPKGIISSGRVVKEPYYDLHWMPVKAERGEKVLRIRFDMDNLLDPEKDKILSLESLLTPPLDMMHWQTQSSGIQIPEDISVELEKIWVDYQAPRQQKLAEELSNSTELFEGASKQITINAYERNPLARQKCIAYYGAKCSVCGFDFLERYGEIGRGYIHVHHLVPISTISGEYKVDPIKDLRPICPNCHAMLHKTDPASSIDELKNSLKQ